MRKEVFVCEFVIVKFCPPPPPPPREYRDHEDIEDINNILEAYLMQVTNWLNLFLPSSKPVKPVSFSTVTSLTSFSLHINQFFIAQKTS